MVHKQKQTTKHLIRLQALIVARAQRQASMPSERCEQLDKEIKTMSNELSLDLKKHFNRLLKKNIEAIVPITASNCSVCGFALTKTMLNRIRSSDELHRCPNCTRILYSPDVSLTCNSPRRRRGDTIKYWIERFSTPDLMNPLLEGKTKEEILLELCKNMHTKGYVEDYEELNKAALAREAIISTAVKNGIAFPHVRGVEGSGLIMALGTSKKGVRFSTTKNQLTRIFFYMIIPTTASAFYLKLLSGLTQSFSTKDTRETLLNAQSQKELWKALTKATKKMI